MTQHSIIQKLLNMMNMQKRNALLALNVVAFVFHMISNFIGFNRSISRKYPTPLSPSGSTPVIWLLIYVLQAIFLTRLCIQRFQNYPAEEITTLNHGPIERHSPTERKPLSFDDYAASLEIWLPFVWVFQSVWTFAFGADMILLALASMCGALLFVGVAFARVQVLIHQEFVMSGGSWRNKNHQSLVNLWITSIPTAINFGWLCVAVCVNTSIAVTKHAGTPGATYTYPTVSVTVGAVLLYLLSLIIAIVAVRTQSASLAFAVVWGVNGVRARQVGVVMVQQAAATGMVLCALAGAIALILPNFPTAAEKLTCGLQSLHDDDESPCERETRTA
jgi:hypothetical protein